MERLTRILIITLVICAAIPAHAEDDAIPAQYRNNPIAYFTGDSDVMWVGSIRFMMRDYSDTLRLSVDSTGEGLVINRVLVRETDTTVVSRGTGTVIPIAGATYEAHWVERNYEEADGTMRWGDEQWEINFEGEWKQWFINIRWESDSSFTAGLARAVGRFPPVELAEMTYLALPADK